MPTWDPRQTSCVIATSQASAAGRQPRRGGPQQAAVRPAAASGHYERRQGRAADVPTLVWLDLQPEMGHCARRDRPELALEACPRGAEVELLSDELSIGPSPI